LIDGVPQVDDFAGCQSAAKGCPPGRLCAAAPLEDGAALFGEGHELLLNRVET